MSGFWIYLISLVIFLSSCTSINQASKIKDGTNILDESTAIKAKGKGNIQLLAHQLTPIDYLHKNPGIKGILVNHYMGTGKTYLGIGFAQSYPDKQVIILAPKFLQSHWQNQLIEYGVTNLKRFTFVSYEDAPKKLTSIDVSNHILLADEVHNLIKSMRSQDAQANAKYTEVYMNLRKAHRILGLTGTPIYSDESDIAFLLNFVSGQELMPFNQETFRLEYTEIKTTRQFFRGYFSESNLLTYSLPGIGMAFGGLLFGLPGLIIAAPLSIFSPIAMNAWLPTETYKLRQLDVKKMEEIMNRYVSYFRFDESQFKDFPAQDFKIETVPYNRKQYSFFLHLVEGDLPVAELQRLLKNNKNKLSDEFVRINSTNIHEQIYSAIGAARDIGNFEFHDDNGRIIEAPKFLKIYEDLQKHNEQTVIYSNYYETGVLAFANFLQRQGYKEKYAIIHPDLSVDEVTQIVADYNQTKIRLLLLHPDVTEGISLKGTQYLHILEPMLNSTVLEQVIGRTRRFQSHTHLAQEKQLVHVRVWKSNSSNWDPNVGDLNRANWYKRYRELSYMSRWGIGISQVDKKYDRKALNPEELAEVKLKTLERNLKEIQAVLSSKSIENNYQQLSFK